MKGRIVFWFNLLPPHFNLGVVTIRLFGQKCESCKQGTGTGPNGTGGEVYEQPMWYPEEVTKVISKERGDFQNLFEDFLNLFPPYCFFRCS